MRYLDTYFELMSNLDHKWCRNFLPFRNIWVHLRSLVDLCCLSFIFVCFVQHCLSLFSFAIVLSVLPWFTASGYPFGIFKLFSIFHALIGRGYIMISRNKIYSLRDVNNKYHQAYVDCFCENKLKIPSNDLQKTTDNWEKRNPKEPWVNSRRVCWSFSTWDTLRVYFA